MVFFSALPNFPSATISGHDSSLRGCTTYHHTGRQLRVLAFSSGGLPQCRDPVSNHGKPAVAVANRSLESLCRSLPNQRGYVGRCRTGVLSRCHSSSARDHSPNPLASLDFPETIQGPSTCSAESGTDRQTACLQHRSQHGRPVQICYHRIRRVSKSSRASAPAKALTVVVSTIVVTSDALMSCVLCLQLDTSCL